MSGDKFIMLELPDIPELPASELKQSKDTHV
jgi:hypothetical protein